MERYDRRRQEGDRCIEEELIQQCFLVENNGLT